jgi:hypothetical protein
VVHNPPLQFSLRAVVLTVMLLAGLALVLPLLVVGVWLPDFAYNSVVVCASNAAASRLQFEFTQAPYVDGYVRLFRYRQAGNSWYYVFLGSELPRIWRGRIVQESDLGPILLFDGNRQIARIEWNAKLSMYVDCNADGSIVSQAFPEN